MATIDADGWLHTGDIAVRDADGYYTIVDRLKELIKYKGFQVPPAELEALLITHPEVADVAVIGVPDENAASCPRRTSCPAGDRLDADALMEFVAGQVSPQKQIRLVEEIDEIPEVALGEDPPPHPQGPRDRSDVSFATGFRHRAGNHCGSTALRNLLAYQGVELSEEMAFGLGAGACFYYVALDGQSPSRFTNGRVARLEEQFVELTGAPLRLETFAGRGRPWDAARAAVDDGRPPLLPDRPLLPRPLRKSAHFPGHAVVLAGYDEEVGLPLGHRLRGASDHRASRACARRGTESTRSSRSPGTCSPCDPEAGDGDPRGAIPAAIDAECEQMLEPPLGEYEGLPALRRFAAEVGDWPGADRGLAVVRALQLPGDRAARHRRRQLPADVLALPRGGGSEEAAWPPRPRPPGRSSPRPCSRRARRTSRPPGRWSAVAAGAAAVLDAEERLWPALAAATASLGRRAARSSRTPGRSALERKALAAAAPLSAPGDVKCGSPNSSPTTRRPPGFSTRDLGQRGVLVGDLAEHRDQAPRRRTSRPRRAATRRRRASARRSRSRARPRAASCGRASPAGCRRSRACPGRRATRPGRACSSRSRADLEHALAGRGLEDLAQPLAGDQGMRRLDPEALAVGAGRRVLAPPQRRSGDRRRPRRSAAGFRSAASAEKPIECRVVDADEDDRGEVERDASPSRS